MPEKPSTNDHFLSGSALARTLGLPTRELFGILAENGWIRREDERWTLTGKGEFEGGRYRSSDKFGRYIVWPDTVMNHRIFNVTGPDTLLSVQQLAGRIGLTPRQTNLLLLELGWIRSGVKGWLVADRGKALGAVQSEDKDTGVPFVRWPATIVGNKVLDANLHVVHAYEHLGDTVERDLFADADAEIHVQGGDGLRALDGHVLRSRAELMICHWLYMSEIVHAHRRKLPVEGDFRCDFYLPALHLYIEYWGDESAPGQLSAKLEKKAIYDREGLNLLELGSSDIDRLDEVLPRKLLKYGLAVY